MDYRKEFIKRALDANAFVSTAAEATEVNHKVWDQRLRDYQEKALVITPQAEQFDFRNGGVDYTVTIDEAPTAALALTEGTDVAIAAFSTRSVTFTPAEYGAAYQLTRNEAARAFFNVADRMTKKLGYALAMKKDSLALTCLLTTTNEVISNSVSATSSLQSTDVLNLTDMSKAKQKIRAKLYDPTAIFISSYQEHSLRMAKATPITLTDASQFGSRDAIQRGLIGELLGLQIFVSDSIAPTNNVEYAVVVGQTGSGEKAMGYAIKRDPLIEKEYHALSRHWNIVAHEEYDFQLLHSDAVCKIATYQ